MKKISLLILLFVSQLSAQVIHQKWNVEAKKVSDCEYDIIFKVKIDKKWHIYSIVPSKDVGESTPSAAYFNFTKNNSFEVVGKMSETKPHKFFDSTFKTMVGTHENEAIFTQRIKLLKQDAVKISGKYSAQECDEHGCNFPPDEKFQFDVQGSVACATSASAAITESVTIDTSSVANLPNNNSTIDTSKNVNQTQVSESEATPAVTKSECNPWDTLLIGLIAGFGAVLMPCIYSLIPLTVSFFLKQSGSRAKGIRNAVLYGLFIILIFDILTMGITVIFGPTALSNIATNTGLNIFFFLLFVVFALSFFGLFEITLPSALANKLDAKADKGGIMGLFFMAATLVVVSFSCTAGFMGGLITAVAKGEGYLCPIVGFTGFGTGIALPFMLFAFFPSWLKNLPKSGGWMTTFKVVIAFIELALAIKFLANADNVNNWGFIKREVFIALWIGIFAMLSLYLLGTFRTSHDDPPSHLSVGRILFATISLSFTIYLIPGLWGAPLRLIASFPPPHHYSESPSGFGGHGSEGTIAANLNTEEGKLEALRVVGPEGLMLFKDDYDNALKYSKLVKKPLFVDFTGNACVNCRLMENNIWSKPNVLKYLKNDVVIVSLYVDSKVDLPIAEQKEVFWFGKQRTLETYGEKWGYMQTTKYNSSSQPQYVVIDAAEKTISNGTKGTELDEAIFADWLAKGISNYKK